MREEGLDIRQKSRQVLNFPRYRFDFKLGIVEFSNGLLIICALKVNLAVSHMLPHFPANRREGDASDVAGAPHAMASNDRLAAHGHRLRRAAGREH